MVSTWMLYCTAVSALVALGAFALERALAALGRPTRGAWAGAIGLSAVLPLALPALAARAPASPGDAPSAAGAALGELQIAGASAAAESTVLRALDGYLAPAWIVSSALLLLGAAALLAVLSLRRRGWRAETVAGVPVLVSARTGPAVVGFLPGRIVLPAWALEWDEERRRMMVEHEREHLRARDPLLLLLAFIAVAALPWNAALWWQLRRLRLAVEVDCDARVLRRHPDVRAYGLLLLEVGRLAASGRLPVVALTEPPSFLERRIRTMTRPALRRRLHRAVLSASVCAGALALAAALPAPAGAIPGSAAIALDPHPSAADTIPLRPGVVDAQRATVRPELLNALQVQRLLQAGYPPLLKAAGVAGTVQVQMVVDAAGAVAEARALEATRPELAEPAVAAMRQARFRPARLDGRPVAVRVQVPVKFEPGAPGTGAGGAPSAGVALGEGIVDVNALDRRPELRNGDEAAGILREGYPPLLKAAGITGKAVVAFVVTAEGATRDVRLVSASRPEFAEPALDAVRAMRFTPGERGGKPAAARVTIPVQFSPPETPQGR